MTADAQSVELDITRLLGWVMIRRPDLLEHFSYVEMRHRAAVVLRDSPRNGVPSAFLDAFAGDEK